LVLKLVLKVTKQDAVRHCFEGAFLIIFSLIVETWIKLNVITHVEGFSGQCSVSMFGTITSGQIYDICWGSGLPRGEFIWQIYTMIAFLGILILGYRELSRYVANPNKTKLKFQLPIKIKK